MQSDKREAILDAALRLFAERGFHGTPVPLIAEQARVGAGTVYRYFKSKEHLVNVLYRREKQELSQHLVEAVPADAGFDEQLHHIWRGLWSFAKANEDSMKFLELHHHGSYLDDESTALETRVMAPLRRMVEKGQTEGALRQQPAELVMATVFGCFLGMFRARANGQLEVGDEVLEAGEVSAWNAIRSSGSPRASGTGGKE